MISAKDMFFKIRSDDADYDKDKIRNNKFITGKRLDMKYTIRIINDLIKMKEKFINGYSNSSIDMKLEKEQVAELKKAISILKNIKY